MMSNEQKAKLIEQVVRSVYDCGWKDLPGGVVERTGALLVRAPAGKVFWGGRHVRVDGQHIMVFEYITGDAFISDSRLAATKLALSMVSTRIDACTRPACELCEGVRLDERGELREESQAVSA